MDLPNLLNRLRHKEEVVKRLLAIEVTPTSVKSAVWQVQGMRTEVVSIGSIQAWDTDDVGDLITALDLSLSEAFAGLETEPNEVVFGLPESWVSKEGIVDVQKPVLKEICRKLGLKPVGFVVTTEAVVQYIRDLEGGPPSSILINISADFVAVSIVYLGQLQGTQLVGKSDSISSDVEEGLARFPRSDNLPSRMILYDGKEDLESAKQDLISYDWQSRLPFLHFPKIESLPKDFTIRAIAVAGGQEVAQSLGYTVESEEMPADSEPEIKPSRKEQVDVVTVEKQESASVSGLPDLATDFGFEETKAESHEYEENIVAVPSEVLTSSSADNEGQIKRKSLFAKVKWPHVPKLSFPKRSTVKLNPRFPLMKMGVGLFLILVVVGSAFWAYWFLPKATVTVYVASKPLEKPLTFILDPEITVADAASNKIPAKLETVEVSGEKSAAATGTKTVGDRAKGEVVIYNRTNAPKSFSAGTAIKYQNFRYTLDSDVIVASASTKYNEDFSVTTEPSKASVKVSAVDIGEQYNLNAGLQFQVGSFSMDGYIANNPIAFSGGSARQVQAVSETDRKTLRDTLVAELTEAVKSKVQAASANREVINTNTQKVSSEIYSAKVGDEANTVSLSMSLSEKVFSYAMSDVTLLAQQAAFNDIPANFIIQPLNTTVTVEKVNLNDDGTASIQAIATLNLLPKLNDQEIIGKIRGKHPATVEDYFKSLTGYSRTFIKYEPELPAFLATFPKQAKNITVITKPAE